MPPLQSDYSDSKWDNKRLHAAARDSGLSSADAFRFLSPWQEWQRCLRQKQKNSHRNKRFFKQLDF